MYLYFSYFLYSIGHPNKHGSLLCDITNDDSNPSTANTSQLDQVIAKTMSKVGVQYPITDQIRACFKSKLWRMGQKISKAGSTKRKQILQSWKDSVWELHIDAIDINNRLVKLQHENVQKLAVQYSHNLQLEKELEIASKEISSKTSQNQKLQSLLSSAQSGIKKLQDSSKQLQESRKQPNRTNK